MNTMDTVAVLIMAVVVPMLTAAAFLLGRHFHRRPVRGDELSAVTRQHIDLFQGGQLNQTLVDAAKAEFRDLLERGELAAVEASLRPGMQYVVQVRALAELGTDEAGRILERQLQRRLSDDEMEQSWYWIDLASSLRALNRGESLPHLLRCADAAGDIPLGHFFAAETVCFLGFAGYLRHVEAPLGRAALRVLHRALEGLRYGVQPYLVTEARLGEMIEGLWDSRPEGAHPLVVRVAAETLRLLRRAPHARAAIPEAMADREGFDLQLSRLSVLEPVLTDYLDEAVRPLRAALASAEGAELCDVLHALDDLRAEAGAEILEVLRRPGGPHTELAVGVLAWSRDARVGAWLREWVERRVAPARRAQRRPRPAAPRRPSVPADVPYRAALRALRGHPSRETELFLLVAALDWDPTYRAAALGSFGWWEPVALRDVQAALQQGRRDPSPEVRQAARAALARLGERQALQWFRQALTGEESQRVHEAIQVVAAEGLTLLWPDLDRLADAEDPEVAQHAREALERMAEDMETRRR
jgi:hypothetical protein